MSDLLVDGFRDHFGKFIVHISASWSATGEPDGTQGTGFIAATATTDGNSYCAVITARHVVVDRPTREICWRLTRHAERGQPSRTCEFTSPGLIEPVSTGPGFIRSNEAGYDAAAIVIPIEAGHAAPFVDLENEAPPTIIDPNEVVREGVEIAWAGYPGVITAALERPQLCLYRGTVSATVLDVGPAGMYCVDGHVARGVSGAPVWHSDETGHRIIGVVSGYWVPGEEMPGLCHFTPVNLLVDELMNPTAGA